MARLLSRVRSAIYAASRSYAVILIVALLVGVLAAPMAYGTAKEYGEPTDKVAVIEIGETIAPSTADPIKQQLREARQNESIKAVVLKVNTPGGSLTATESLALEVERTAAEMPVVVSVSQIAASGGYYVSAPADEIVANPSALVGSVGINFAYIDAAAATGTTVQSGPDKSSGFTEEEAIEMADIMVEGFYGMVLDHRGDELELTKGELAYAKVYPSQKAVHNGMIDEIGTIDTAIQRAAERADLDRYEVVELETTADATRATIIGQTSGDDGDISSQHAQMLLDPAPGVETPVPLALYGTLPDERTIVTTNGAGSTTTIDDGNQDREDER